MSDHLANRKTAAEIASEMSAADIINWFRNHAEMYETIGELPVIPALSKRTADILEAAMQREERLQEALKECENYLIECGRHQGEWEATLFAMIHDALNPSE